MYPYTTAKNDVDGAGGADGGADGGGFQEVEIADVPLSDVADALAEEADGALGTPALGMQHPATPKEEDLGAATQGTFSPATGPMLATLARVTGQVGGDAMFVLCERCVDPRKAAAALAISTGIPPANILCTRASLQEDDAAPARAGTPWRSAVSVWYASWAKDRAGKMRPAFAPMRETIQLWAMLSGQPTSGGDPESSSNNEDIRNALQQLAGQFVETKADGGKESSASPTKEANENNSEENGDRGSAGDV